MLIPNSLQAFLGRDFDAIEETQLRNLIGFIEGDELDFKSSLYADTEPARRDLAWDVASFANSRGGLIVMGVAEDNDGRAVDLAPLALPEHEEPLRIRQIIAGRVFPTPSLACRTISSQAARYGYVLLAVPRSALAPHAVREDDRLRYLKRSGAGNRAISESEVADEYRRRFVESDARVVRLRDIHDSGWRRLDRSNYAWLALTLVPLVAGEMELRAGVPGRIAEWAKEIEGDAPLRAVDFRQQALYGSTRVGRVIVSDGRQPGDPGYAFQAELYADGSGFAAGYAGWRRANQRLPGAPDNDNAALVLVPDEHLAFLAAELLLILAAHAVQHAGCTGEAAAVADLLTMKDGGAMVLQKSWGDRLFAATLGNHLTLRATSMEHLISVDDAARPGGGLLSASRLVLADLVHEFGLAEPFQFTAAGAIRRRYLDAPERQQIESWATSHSVELSDEQIPG